MDRVDSLDHSVSVGWSIEHFVGAQIIQKEKSGNRVQFSSWWKWSDNRLFGEYMEHDLHTFNTISEASGTNVKYLQFVERKGPWKLKCIFLCHLFSVIQFSLLTNCYTLSNCVLLSNKLFYFYRQWEESTRCFRWVATMVPFTSDWRQLSTKFLFRLRRIVNTSDNCQQLATKFLFGLKKIINNVNGQQLRLSLQTEDKGGNGQIFMRHEKFTKDYKELHTSDFRQSWYKITDKIILMILIHRWSSPSPRCTSSSWTRGWVSSHQILNHLPNHPFNHFNCPLPLQLYTYTWFWIWTQIVTFET